MTSDSWIRGGFDQVEQDYQEIKDNQKPFRFWVNVGRENITDIVFLDDFNDQMSVDVGSNEFRKINKYPRIFLEHQVNFDGKWDSHFTCSLQSHGTCPICEIGDRPYKIYMLSVLKKWTDRNGNEKWSKNVFATKNKGIQYVSSVATNKKLAKRINGNFQYAQCTIERTSKQDVKTGNILQFIDKIGEEEVSKLTDDYSSYDFTKIYKAKDPAIIKRYIEQGRLKKNPPYNERFTPQVSFASKPAKQDMPPMPTASSFDFDNKAPEGKPPF